MPRSFRAVAITTALVGALALAGCTGGNSASQSNGSASSSLTIDSGFTIETADPGHTYDPTGNLVAKALYETLVDFDGSDVSTPVPGLASWTQNDDATEFTFTMQEGHTFSDGSPVEAKDVLFTLQRLQAMTDAKPNFLLTGLTIDQPSDDTITFTSETPSLQLPAILASPALGILNSDVVKENGGTTDGADTAQAWLDKNSAGSGPYTLDTLDLTSQIVLSANAEYSGDAPAYSRVVLRNVAESATQLINLQGGDADVALDLNGDQVGELGDGFTVDSVPSAQTIFLLVNQDPAVGGVTATPEFAAAVRAGLNYDDLLELAGAGSVTATGVIPPGFEGALTDEPKTDEAAAKAALAASGYNGETVTLSFPNDYPVGGVDFTSVAERVQAQLEAIGVTVELAPAPFATELDAYVGGKEQFGLWFWGPDYADSANFLPFAPGLKVGLRSGWTAEESPELAALAAQAYAAVDTDERTALFTEFATKMQQEGPFVPLIVPGSNIATKNTVTGAAYNSVWTIDLGELKPAS
jgi:peptide/nickel transport system substrate-binding protein